jgi:hypothetical protein
MIEQEAEERPATPEARPKGQRRSTRVEVNGWLCLD